MKSHFRINQIVEESRRNRNQKSQAIFLGNWKNRFGWMLKLA